MRQTTEEIKKAFAQATSADLSALYALYETDPRASVRKLAEGAKKKEAALQNEKARIEGMRIFEEKYASYALICGVDEVGRGPLAGPVVAGAVILPKGCRILYLNDSKKLSAKMREALYEEIQEKALAFATAAVSPERIDEINILQATYEAMRAAVNALHPAPEVLLNDAVTIPGLLMPQVPIIKGDEKSLTIAAASVLAKVTRDRMMQDYDAVYPEYGFGGHKGYGAAVHIDAIRKYGVTPIHRRSFLRHILESNPFRES